MISILNNPYRILGLPLTASNRDIVKRINELEMYAEMGKTKTYEMDFPFLSPLDRSIDSIREASSTLEQADSKFLSSLYWFWKNDSVDELAIDLLQDGKYEKAISIWRKVSTGRKNSHVSGSNLKNLYTLYLLLSFANEKIDNDCLVEGIETAGRFFSNGFVATFARIVNGKDHNFQHNFEIITNSFVNEILTSVTDRSNQHPGIDMKTIMNAFQAFPAQTYRYSKKRVINEPLYNIKQHITRTKQKRSEDPENANSYGIELYKGSLSDLEYIESLLSGSDAEYQMLSDNLAEEILQCAIDYFNSVRDSTAVDPGDDALFLAEAAQKIVTGIRVEKRVIDATTAFREWIDDKPERDRLKPILKHIDHITKNLNLLPDIEAIDAVKTDRLLEITSNLIDNCLLPLQAIGHSLGKTDDLYLEISSEVVGRALVMCIQYANHTENFMSTLKVMEKLPSLDLAPSLHQAVEKNIEIITKNAKIKREEKAAEVRMEKTKCFTDAIQKMFRNLPEPTSLTDDNISTLPETIREFLMRCMTNLSSIKRITGDFDEFYVNVSTSVAHEALGMCVVFINKTGDINAVYDLMKLIGTMDMNKEMRLNYKKNKDLADQLKINKILRSNSGTNRKTDSGWCYIATMVYGDYNAPEVLELRRFRDNVLERLLLGRTFITVYYKLSPLFVAKFGHSRFIRVGIKYILQQLIKVVGT